jgi:hypothetical protein
MSTEGKQLGYIGIDQYGNHYILNKYPRKELLAKLSCKHAGKMYCDKKDGSTVHTGYIINGLWITVLRVSEWKV